MFCSAFFGLRHWSSRLYNFFVCCNFHNLKVSTLALKRLFMPAAAWNCSKTGCITLYLSLSLYHPNKNCFGFVFCTETDMIMETELKPPCIFSLFFPSSPSRLLGRNTVFVLVERIVSSPFRKQCMSLVFQCDNCVWITMTAATDTLRLSVFQALWSAQECFKTTKERKDDTNIPCWSEENDFVSLKKSISALKIRLLQ